jgi:hypothetical protein
VPPRPPCVRPPSARVAHCCPVARFFTPRSKLCEKVDRSAIIVQTKVPPKKTAEEFREALTKSFEALKPPGGYIDLFGFHGVNNEERLEWTKLCMPVAKEFQAEGKIKHIGFSTHAMTTTILNAIETDMFDCKPLCLCLRLRLRSLTLRGASSHGLPFVRLASSAESCAAVVRGARRRQPALPVHRFVHLDRLRLARRLLLQQARHRGGAQARHGRVYHLAHRQGRASLHATEEDGGRLWCAARPLPPSLLYRRRRRRRRRGCRLQTVASGCLYPELCVAGSERHSSRCDIAHMD